MWIEFRRTAEESDGELVEFDLVGRPQGVITLPHVHPAQSERHEVIEGSMRMKTRGLERLLAPGDVVFRRCASSRRSRARSCAPRP